MTEYVVIYEQAEDGAWGAYLPDLPGGVALGATREEVSAGIREASAPTPRICESGGWTSQSPTTHPTSSPPDFNSVASMSFGRWRAGHTLPRDGHRARLPTTPHHDAQLSTARGRQQSC